MVVSSFPLWYGCSMCLVWGEYTEKKVVFFVNASNFFLQREQQLLGDRFQTLYTYSDTPAKGITVNPIRLTAQKIEQEGGLLLEKSPFCENGFLLKGEQKPGRHPYHHGGAFYVQEPSASAAAPLLEVQPGMKVADLCAAPGGKTSQLAATLQGKGFLLANEYQSSRAEILKSNLERMGVYNALITNEDTAKLAKVFTGFFDRILVDAPCSGEGMFRKEPQAVDQHCEGLVKQCAGLGKEILENAAQMLKAGGILVYSTCTFSPEEDEMQLAEFLHNHPDFQLMDCGNSWGSGGEKNRCGEFSLEVEKVRRIWPCNGGEGHFIAKLKKLEQAEEILPQFGKTQKPTNAKQLQEWQTFSQGLFEGIEEFSAPPVRVGDSIYLPVKEPLPKGAEKLKIVRNGVFAGTVQKNRFVPSHQLFMAFGAYCTNQEQLTLSDPRTQAWLRGEEIDAVTAQSGWCVVLVDGIPLGCGKRSGEKIKNHYPKALRNLK